MGLGVGVRVRDRAHQPASRGYASDDGCVGLGGLGRVGGGIRVGVGVGVGVRVRG